MRNPKISTARRAGAAKKGFGPVKKYMGGGHPMAKTKKKSGGAVKMQGGGLSRAQQNMLRQAQEYAASSGQNPAALRKLTAQHGDLYGAGQQKKARSQMAGNQPGRTSMRGIGPGMKSGGAAKKKSGGAVKKKSGGAVKMQGGGLSRAQQNMLRQAQEYAASSGQNPAALRKLTAQHGDLFGASQQKKAKRQLAGSKPGRTSMRGIGPGMKSGGVAKKKSGGVVKKQTGGMAPTISPNVKLTRRQQMQSQMEPSRARAQRGLDAYNQRGSQGLGGAAFQQRPSGGLQGSLGGGPANQNQLPPAGGTGVPGQAKHLVPGGKKGGAVKARKKSKPRGVGVAKRGFGRALR